MIFFKLERSKHHIRSKGTMADSTTQMFIGNLPWSIRARHLEIDFGEYGEVTDAFVAYKGRRSRGFGFVTMAKPEDAAKAQKALDGKKVSGRHPA